MGSIPIVLTDPGDLPNAYCPMIAMAWFFYDYALTFGDEVQYIWRRKVTWSAIMFLLTRYLAGLMVIVNTLPCTVRGFTAFECSLFAWFEGIGTFILFFFIQVILQLRLYVMYNRSRRIFIINACLMVIEFGVSGVLMKIYYPNVTPVIVPPSTLGSCYVERPQESAAVWAPPVAFESYLAILAVWKIVQEHSLLRDTSSLMSLMVRDNIVYFLLIVLAMTVNPLVFAFTTGLNPGNSGTTIVPAAGAIGATRIILSLLRNSDNVLTCSTLDTAYDRTTGTCIMFGTDPRASVLD